MIPSPAALNARPEPAGGDCAQAAPPAARGGPSRRVLMIAPTSFFADYGCHVRILEEARALQRLGQRVAIATYFNGQDPEGLDIRRTLPIPWRRGYEVGSSRHKLGFDLLLGATALRAALGFRPDIVHGHLHEGALIGWGLARLLGRPLVFDFQGSLTAEMIDHGFLNPRGPFHGAVRRMEERIHRLPEAIITSSQNATEHLAEAFGLPRRRIFTLPDGVDAGTFRPGLLGEAERAAARSALGIPPGRRVVVYLGLLARHQGTDLLLEAARRLVDRRPDTHFLIMGFPATAHYAARAAALGLGDHCSFTGRVPYAEAPARLALGDLAVAPKISQTEGYGKLLNYMAMGLPTVAFDLPVCREYLGEDGLLVPAGEVEALAEAMRGLLDDPGRAAAMGGRLRARALAGHDWIRGGERLIAVYDRALRSRRLRAASA